MHENALKIITHYETCKGFSSSRAGRVIDMRTASKRVLDALYQVAVTAGDTGLRHKVLSARANLSAGSNLTQTRMAA